MFHFVEMRPLLASIGLRINQIQWFSGLRFNLLLRFISTTQIFRFISTFRQPYHIQSLESIQIPVCHPVLMPHYCHSDSDLIFRFDFLIVIYVIWLFSLYYSRFIFSLSFLFIILGYIILRADAILWVSLIIMHPDPLRTRRAPSHRNIRLSLPPNLEYPAHR
jgi:hypothetical protein